MIDSHYRPKDIAALFGVHLRTVYTWIAKGDLPAPSKLGPKILFWPKEQIDALWKTKQESGK
jgi:excisionase family DNA binding protein